jgi:hypothetical protein
VAFSHRARWVGAGLAAVLLATLLLPSWRARATRVVLAARGQVKTKKTIDDCLAEFGAAARGRLAPGFRDAGVAYPPSRVVLAAFKTERRLEVWAAAPTGAFFRVAGYPIRGASGRPGPKLREGDHQVPEGIYRIESLNPNSRFHVSLRLDYPNEFDRQWGAADGRTSLGGDIMIHGGSASVGCLAMGDAAAEDLFTLAAHTGLAGVRVVISPVDFRTGAPPPADPKARPWLDGLYARIRQALDELRVQARRD